LCNAIWLLARATLVRADITTPAKCEFEVL
jgi:hypothetical protein